MMGRQDKLRLSESSISFSEVVGKPLIANRAFEGWEEMDGDSKLDTDRETWTNDDKDGDGEYEDHKVRRRHDDLEAKEQHSSNDLEPANPEEDESDQDEVYQRTKMNNSSMRLHKDLGRPLGTPEDYDGRLI
jgi:hypothetical protein